MLAIHLAGQWNRAGLQAGEAAHVHPYRQVLERADVLWIGRAFDRYLLRAGALSRAVAARGAFRRGTVEPEAEPITLPMDLSMDIDIRKATDDGQDYEDAA